MKITTDIFKHEGRNRLFPPLALMGLIFISSSIPMDTSQAYQWVPFIAPSLQNLLHVPLYAALSFLWLRALAPRNIKVSAAIILSIIISSCYGCIDELHQTFVPGRYGGVTDVVLNLAGAIIGVSLGKLFLKPSRRAPVK